MATEMRHDASMILDRAETHRGTHLNMMFRAVLQLFSFGDIRRDIGGRNFGSRRENRGFTRWIEGVELDGGICLEEYSKQSGDAVTEGGGRVTALKFD